MYIIKVGGGETINWNNICEDIVGFLKKESLIIIHGASNKRDGIAKRLNQPTKTVISPSGITSVYTDKGAMDIFTMVYAGLVNKQIVAKMHGFGINAVGLSGVDGKLWLAKRKSEIYIKEADKIKLLKNNLTGRVENINTDLINVLVKNHYIPVICPPAISYDNKIVNTDGDWATAVMAQALGVKKIIVLFEASGLLKDYQNEASIIPVVDRRKLADYLKYANGRMKKKLLGAKKAFEGGVTKIYWGDGRIKNPIKNALSGKGTIIC